MSKPKFKWPLISLAFAIYVFGAAFVDSFIDVEEDQAEAMGALVVAVVWIAVTVLVINRRIDKFDDWKEQQEDNWALKRDLPAAPVPDWERVERQAEEQVRNESG